MNKFVNSFSFVSVNSALRSLLMAALLLIGGATAFAQGTPPPDEAPPGLPGNPQMQSIATFNNKINDEITAGNLNSHTLLLNSGVNKRWGQLANYHETVQFYFDASKKIPILKKVVASGNAAGRMTYTDILFDEAGDIYLILDDKNAASAAELPVTYYFMKRDLVGILRNNMAINPDEFVDNDQYGAIEMLNKAENYKKTFDKVLRIQEEIK